MDFNAMRLRAHGDPTRLDEILQTECRHKYAAKFARTLQCGEFRFPSLLSAEQATGDAAALCHAALIPEDADVLDMTAGLGIDALHAAARARSVTAIERDADKAEALRHNAAALGVDNLTVVCADSTQWLAEHADERYDVIFIDPARRSASGGRVFGLPQCEPDVTLLLPMLKERCKRLIVKASPMLDVSRTIADLGGDADIMVIGTRSECKEVVGVWPGTGRISAVTLGPEDERIDFTLAEEAAATPSYRASEAGMWLYEPYPAVMKAAPLRLLCQRYGVSAIAPNTHVYLSDTPVAGFPGRCRRIADVSAADRRTCRAWQGRCAEVAVRNYPLTAEALRRRLRVTDGPDAVRLLGVTDADGRPLLLTLTSTVSE